MSEHYEVIAKVTAAKGFCEAGHKVGDEFLIGRKTPEGLGVMPYSNEKELLEDTMTSDSQMAVRAERLASWRSGFRFAFFVARKERGPNG